MNLVADLFSYGVDALISILVISILGAKTVPPMGNGNKVIPLLLLIRIVHSLLKVCVMFSMAYCGVNNLVISVRFFWNFVENLFCGSVV